MRNLVVGVVFPVGLLVYMVYVRGENNGTKLWHPWQLTWDLWLASVILTSMMVGIGLHMHWIEGVWRRRHPQPFDHDQVQLDADPDN